MTRPEDVRTIYDNLRSKDKERFWIEGTTRRFDGYNYFGEQPEKMLGWLNTISTSSNGGRRADAIVTARAELLSLKAGAQRTHDHACQFAAS